VFMWVKGEAAGSPVVVGPAMATAITVALVATLVLGIFPRPLFELAEASARTLGVVGITAFVR